MSQQTYISGESANRTNKTRREIHLKERATLILDEEVVAQITFLHLSRKNVEWSGFLFFIEEEGSLEDPSSLVLRAKCMAPMNVGTAAYTSFTLNSDSLIDMMDRYPEFETHRKGLIHTHHNMQAFFSGTDQDELQENAENHVYYLSLIVNNAGPWVARIAATATMSSFTKVRRKNSSGDYIETEPQQIEEEVLYLIDCDITHSFSEGFIAQWDSIKTPKPAASNNINSNINSSFFNDNEPLYNRISRQEASDLLNWATTKIMLEPNLSFNAFNKLTYSQQKSVAQVFTTKGLKVTEKKIGDIVDLVEESLEKLSPYSYKLANSKDMNLFMKNALEEISNSFYLYNTLANFARESMQELKDQLKTRSASYSVLIQ